MIELKISKQQAVAVVENYPELLQALKLRRQTLAMPLIELDNIAGLQEGYARKIEAGLKNLGPTTLGKVLAALGLELWVMLSSPKNEILRLKRNGLRPISKVYLKKRLLSENAKRLASKMTPEERRARARSGGKTRWKGHVKKPRYRPSAAPTLAKLTLPPPRDR